MPLCITEAANAIAWSRADLSVCARAPVETPAPVVDPAPNNAPNNAGEREAPQLAANDKKCSQWTCGGGGTCKSRIEWLQTARNPVLSCQAAVATVKNECPEACGGCQASSCLAPPSKFCSDTVEFPHGYHGRCGGEAQTACVDPRSKEMIACGAKSQALCPLGMVFCDPRER